MIADALDLRHRLPILWQRVQAGRVRAWRARRVAQATRHLGGDAAGLVDRAVANFIVSLSWNRFETLLAAKIIEPDPRAAEERAKIWEARTVRPLRIDQPAGHVTGQLGIMITSPASACAISSFKPVISS